MLLVCECEFFYAIYAILPSCTCSYFCKPAHRPSCQPMHLIRAHIDSPDSAIVTETVEKQFSWHLCLFQHPHLPVA